MSKLGEKLRRRAARPRRRRDRPAMLARSEVRRHRNPLLRALGDADQALLRFLRTRGHDPATERAMKALGAAGEWGTVWVALATGAAAADRARRTRWLAAAAVGPLAVGANYAVKVAVGRERPLIEGHPPLAKAPSKLSFPSAHATSSLAAATAMGRVSPGARPALYALASAICFSRPYLGMHYPSDVLAGALLGTLIGSLAPGVRGAGPEDRLIDLVVRGATEEAGPGGAGPSSNGAGATAGAGAAGASDSPAT